MAESLSEIFERLLAKQQILLERYNAMKDKLQISQEENEALKKENEKQRQLIEKLWDIDGDFIDEHTLTTIISRIRKKIEADERKYIKTAYGMGYQWIGGESR